MRQMRIGIVLGAVLALCSGVLFASEHRVEGQNWEQGYGYSSQGYGAMDQVAVIAEAPRLREHSEPAMATLLSKRTSPTMLAKSGHFEALEVAAVSGRCSAGIGVGEG